MIVKVEQPKGKELEYRIIAVNKAGEGEPSNTDLYRWGLSMAHIKINCPKCKALFKVDEVHIGKKGCCRLCGERFRIVKPQDAVRRDSQTVDRSAAKLLDKARSELATILEQDGRVGHPVAQGILHREFQALDENLAAAVKALQAKADGKYGGLGSHEVGVGLSRLCDATLNDPKWALQKAVGTDRCRDRVAKVLREVERVTAQLRRDTHGGGTVATERGERDEHDALPVALEKGGLLEYLDKAKGTDELYEMLRSRSISEIEEVCKTFPIETLRLDWNSIMRDFRNNKRFELILVLTQILLKYEKILENNPELQLPKSLPAKTLSEILMSRLMPFISSQENVDIAHGLRTELYDFAMDLIRVGRNSDALTCLLVSRPSIKKDHDYWICACRFNIAQDTKDPNDVTTAIAEIEQFMSTKGKVPQESVRMLEKMLSTLQQRLNGSNNGLSEETTKEIREYYKACFHKAFDAARERKLDNVRVPPGQSEVRAVVLALFQPDESLVTSARDSAEKQTMTKYRITKSQLKSIIK